jgi:hypothetical protein
LAPSLENAMPVGVLSCSETSKESTGEAVETSNGAVSAYSYTLAGGDVKRSAQRVFVYVDSVAAYHEHPGAVI